jgi:hypothetical protein
LHKYSIANIRLFPVPAANQQKLLEKIKKITKPITTTEMERQLRKDIASAVESAVRDTMAKMEERWLTADELCKHFGMISKEWLKEYGDTLPRQRFVVETLDGQKHKTRWGYPLHEINAGIAAGRFQKLKVMKM